MRYAEEIIYPEFCVNPGDGCGLSKRINRYYR